MRPEYYASLSNNQRKFADFVIKKNAQIKAGYSRHQGMENPIFQIARAGVHGKKVRLGPDMGWTDEQKEIVRWLLEDLHQYSPVYVEGPYIIDANSPSSQDPEIAAYEKEHGLTQGTCVFPARLVTLAVYATLFGETQRFLTNAAYGRDQYEDPWEMLEKVYHASDKGNPFSYLHWGRNEYWNKDPEASMVYRHVYNLGSWLSEREIYGRND